MIPLTTYYLNYYKQKLKEASQNVLFKDNEELIYKYFGILEEDNSGYIYFSPLNLYYSYTNWDNFYQSLLSDIEANGKTYPSITKILDNLDWSNDIEKVVESLNQIISSIDYQNRILEYYDDFPFIDPDFLKLKDATDLTETETRLRGRLLLQEILPVQQYSGGEMYDLSHVEYIKAFFESKGTIRDTEYLMKFFGYSVDLSTAGDKIIPYDIDWATYDDTALKTLLHPEVEEVEETPTASIDTLIAQDIEAFAQNYKYDCSFTETTQTFDFNQLTTNVTDNEVVENIYNEVQTDSIIEDSTETSSDTETTNTTDTSEETENTTETTESSETDTTETDTTETTAETESETSSTEDSTTSSDTSSETTEDTENIDPFATDTTTEDEEKVLSLNFTIDILGDSFKGFFTNDVEKTVTESLEERSTSKVTIDTIFLESLLKELYTYPIEELLIRFLHFVESYEKEINELLTYQKNIVDCRQTFSIFSNKVDNLCYYRLSNIKPKKVGNRYNDDFEDVSLYETYIFTETDNFEKLDNLLADLGKLQIDTYNVYRYVNNRIKKSVKNINPIIITNEPLIDDKHYTYLYEAKHTDKCFVYYTKVNNRVPDIVDNKRYCKVVNRDIDDRRYTYAPTFSDDKWDFEQSDEFNFEKAKLSFYDENTYNQDDEFNFRALNSFTDVMELLKPRVNNTKLEFVNNRNNFYRNVRNVFLEENLAVFRNFFDEIILDIQEQVTHNLENSIRDQLLPDRVDNKRYIKVDNKVPQKVFNDARVKENITFERTLNLLDKKDILENRVNNSDYELVDNTRYIKVSNRRKIVDSVALSKIGLDDTYQYEKAEEFVFDLKDTETISDMVKDLKKDTFNYEDATLTFKEWFMNSRVSNSSQRVVDNRVERKLEVLVDSVLSDLFRTIIEAYDYKLDDVNEQYFDTNIAENYFSYVVDNSRYIRVSNQNDLKVSNNLRPVNDDYSVNTSRLIVESVFDKKISNDNYTVVDNEEQIKVTNRPIADITEVKHSEFANDEYNYENDEDTSKRIYKNDDVYSKYLSKYLVNGEAKFKINNSDYIILNNLNTRKEAERVSFVHIKREDGQEFDWYFDEINEENFDWYIRYTYTETAEIAIIRSDANNMNVRQDGDYFYSESSDINSNVSTASNANIN